MGWRCVMVESPARISVRQRQLIIETDEPHQLPMEDLCALLLESPRCQVTTAALAAMAKAGALMWVCDEKHMPCAVLLPYARHSRHSAVAQAQLNMSAARKKRLWQQVVRAKIENQAMCQQLRDNAQAAAALRGMAKQVTSGDGSHRESAAAALHFRALFGPRFARWQEHGINAALNYGYALMRGLTARVLTVYGFMGALGIHHHSELNAFNLCDDLMEPLRAIVDLWAAQHASEDMLLSAQEKRRLFSLLSVSVRIGTQRHSLVHAMELYVQSLIRAMRPEEKPALRIPGLLPLAPHQDE